MISLKTDMNCEVDQFIFFLLTRIERETFMKKFAAFKPTSLYKVDLQRVRQAGREVDEECEKEDIKTVIW